MNATLEVKIAETDDSPRMPYNDTDVRYWAWKSRVDDLARRIAQLAEAIHGADRERIALLGAIENRPWLTDLSDDETAYYRKGL